MAALFIDYKPDLHESNLGRYRLAHPNGLSPTGWPPEFDAESQPSVAAGMLDRSIR